MPLFWVETSQLGKGEALTFITESGGWRWQRHKYCIIGVCSFTDGNSGPCCFNSGASDLMVRDQKLLSWLSFLASSIGSYNCPRQNSSPLFTVVINNGQSFHHQRHGKPLYATRCLKVKVWFRHTYRISILIMITLFPSFLLLYKVDINVSCIMCPNGRLVCLIDDQMVYKVMGVGCAIERELQWWWRIPAVTQSYKFREMTL